MKSLNYWLAALFLLTVGYGCAPIQRVLSADYVKAEQEIISRIEEQQTFFSQKLIT